MNDKNNKVTTENLQFRYLYGFGILFVVLSHCDGGGIQMLSNWMHFGAFHLAIFVFGSGYFFEKENLQKPMCYLWQKVKRLLIPLWCWNLFYGVVIALMHRIGFTFGETLNLRSLLLGPVLNKDLYLLNMGSWFVFPFFMVQLIYGVLKWILDRLGKPAITDRILQLLYILAGLFGISLSANGYDSELWSVIFRILYFMPFYALGMWHRELVEKRFRKIPAMVVLGVCMLAALLLNTWFGRTVYAIPSTCDYPFGVVATYLAAMIGITFWLKVSQLLAEKCEECKPLTMLGRSTWEIMIHQFAGIMAVKCLLAGANRLFGLFADFDWNVFYGDIWYLYRPKGIAEYAFLYVIGAIALPILIKWLLQKVRAGVKKSGK